MRVPLDSCLCGQPAGCGDGSMLWENETRGPLDLRGWFRTPDVIVEWHLGVSISLVARISSFPSLATQFLWRNTYPQGSFRCRDFGVRLGAGKGVPGAKTRV